MCLTSLSFYKPFKNLFHLQFGYRQTQFETLILYNEMLRKLNNSFRKMAQKVNKSMVYVFHEVR